MIIFERYVKTFLFTLKKNQYRIVLQVNTLPLAEKDAAITLQVNTLLFY